MPSRLRVTGGRAAGTVIEIGDELVVGRSAEGAGTLGGDPELSRRHARVYTEPGGGLAVEDLGSTNGTFVNGERVTGSRPLPPGATLRMGQSELVVEGDAAATQVESSIPPPPPAAPPQPQAAPPAPQAPPPPPVAPPQPPAPAPPAPAAPHLGAPPPPPTQPLPPAAGAPQYPGAPPAPPYGGTPAAQPSGGGRGRLIAAVAAGILALGGIVAAVLLLTGGDDKEEKADLPVEGPPALVEAARAAGCTAITEPSEGANHVEVPPDYKSNPPHSGDHDMTPASDARYAKQPPIGQLVHSLEHGRIILWYKPGDDETAKKLLEIGREDPNHMILTPNETGMEYEAAASAWTHVLGCPEWNDEVPAAIEAFRDAYRDKGPELVP